MLQRKLSSFDIHTVVFELQRIKNAIIEKSYQISKDEIIIKITQVETKKKEILYIKNGGFLTVTDKSFETPARPSNFIMALRKYVQNGRILDIIQHEFDRIINIRIGKKQGIFTLIIEFFSDGNIIIVDPEGHIIIPFIQQTWAHRKVKGRQLYQPPPSQINPFTMSKHSFSDILHDSNADVVRTLAVKLNLSGPIAEEICQKTDIDKTVQASKLDEIQQDHLFYILQDFLKKFENHQYQPVIIKKDDIFVDVLPFPFESYKDSEMIPIETFTRGLSMVIPYDEPIQKKSSGESKQDERIGKLYRMLAQQQKKINELDETINLKMHQGELIYLHYNTVDNLLHTIQKAMDEKEKNKAIISINNLDIVNIFDPKKNKLIITLPDTSDNLVEIPLSFKKSVSENAEHAYDESKKAQKKKHGAEKSIEKTKETLQKVIQDKQRFERQLQQKTKEKKTIKRFWFEQYRWTISSQGNLILGGKDVKTNEQLIKKHMEKQDRYVHADIHGAPSCIVKKKTYDDNPIDISDKTLDEVCVFAACYSRAWKQFSEAQVYWVLPQQVSKTPQSGEYVPKGAFIIRGKRNYCKCDLILGIGELILENERRWIGGSIDAIKKWCDPYIIIKPGGISRKDFSHLVAKKTDVSADEINQILPPGGVSIVETYNIDLEQGGDDR
jgi:predicted ribosome quality control (RQC) complex YloA/Tae2 family protein